MEKALAEFARAAPPAYLIEAPEGAAGLRR